MWLFRTWVILSLRRVVVAQKAGKRGLHIFIVIKYFYSCDDRYIFLLLILSFNNQFINDDFEFKDCNRIESIRARNFVIAYNLQSIKLYISTYLLKEHFKTKDAIWDRLCFFLKHLIAK